MVPQFTLLFYYDTKQCLEAHGLNFEVSQIYYSSYIQTDKRLCSFKVGRLAFVTCVWSDLQMIMFSILSCYMGAVNPESNFHNFKGVLSI